MTARWHWRIRVKFFGWLVVFASSSVASTANAQPVRQDRELMHTVVTVELADPLSDDARTAAFDDAFAVFEDIDQTLNEWKPESALGRINASAGGAPVEADAQVCEVLRASLEGARKTKGLFDPTWAALRDLWRFSDAEASKVPTTDAVAKQCALVGYRDVEVKPVRGATDGRCTVRLKRAGMKLGLGGLVKGWGVDQAVATLRKRGLKNFFIQAGGDLYFAGQNGDRPWKSGIRDPRGASVETIFAKLEVSDRAFSTSADNEHFFIDGDVRYHHIIDLRTCWPAKASRSVTVLAKNATDAEFLTKSVFALGGEKGLALAESLGALAVIVGADNHVYVSKGLKGSLELWQPTP